MVAIFNGIMPVGPNEGNISRVGLWLGPDAGQIVWNRFTGPGKISLQTMYCHMAGDE